VNRDSRIYVAGHRGLVGSAISRELTLAGYTNLITYTRAQLDLKDATAVRDMFKLERPEYVFMAAAKVGGILANNTYPADFIRDNLAIELNIIEQSRRFDVQRLLFLGSSCIYPRLCPQPIREEYLLTGELESTNRSYAIAKIAGIEMCWSYNRQYGTQYLAAMPTNLYGPGDNFDLKSSHVLPALIRKVFEAKSANNRNVEVWGTGTVRREMLYSEDLAEACVFVMNLPEQTFQSLLNTEHPPLVNIGTGIDVTIRELAERVCRVLEFEGELVFDLSKPDGTPRKLLDVSRIHGLGWHAKTDLSEGISKTYQAAREQLVHVGQGGGY
jgi:GDP-L-fucose synthase